MVDYIIDKTKALYKRAKNTITTFVRRLTQKAAPIKGRSTKGGLKKALLTVGGVIVKTSIGLGLAIAGGSMTPTLLGATTVASLLWVAGHTTVARSKARRSGRKVGLLGASEIASDAFFYPLIGISAHMVLGGLSAGTLGFLFPSILEAYQSISISLVA